MSSPGEYHLDAVDRRDAYEECLRVVAREYDRVTLYPSHPADVKEILERIHASIVAVRDMRNV